MKKNEAPKDMNKTLKLVIAVLSVVLLALLSVAIVMSNEELVETTPTTEPTTVPTTAPTTQPPETETTVPPETEPDPTLDHLREIHEMNEDIEAWITIGDTIIDYPIAFNPEEPEKYDRRNIYGEYSYYGTLYISQRCSLDPESQNLIIYGHNMNNGKMFSDLNDYEDEEFWKEHPIIQFWTRDGIRTYEVMAAFYDRIYNTWEKDVFRYYKFVDPETEEEFDEGIAQFKDKALYDTGVTAEYGDRLITLMTCSYHTEHGRFVLVAVEHMDKDAEGTEPTQTTSPEA